MADLKGIKVLVTRPEDQNDNLCHLIDSSGGNAIRFPTLKSIPSDQITHDQMMELLIWSSHCVFISKNSVRFICQLLDNIASALRGKEVFATGKGTALELEKIGITLVHYPSTHYGSEGLLEHEKLNESNIAGKNLLIIRGVVGRELLRESLMARGAKVKYARIYRNIVPANPQQLESIWEVLIPDIIVVTSNQGLGNLMEMTDDKYKSVLLSRRLVVMSSRVAEAAVKNGFVNSPVVVTDQSDEGMIEAIQSSVEQ